mmetsp:Transcript_19868/g.58025  ORF Transcript_19868/g.58025 Transcript_19868/m.58025 type:complete len:362 (-) Transcript_19868:766-1851(-)
MVRYCTHFCSTPPASFQILIQCSSSRVTCSRAPGGSTRGAAAEVAPATAAAAAPLDEAEAPPSGGAVPWVAGVPAAAAAAEVAGVAGVAEAAACCCCCCCCALVWAVRSSLRKSATGPTWPLRCTALPRASMTWGKSDQTARRSTRHWRTSCMASSTQGVARPWSILWAMLASMSWGWTSFARTRRMMVMMWSLRSFSSFTGSRDTQLTMSRGSFLHSSRSALRRVMKISSRKRSSHSATFLKKMVWASWSAVVSFSPGLIFWVTSAIWRIRAGISWSGPRTAMDTWRPAPACLATFEIDVSIAVISRVYIVTAWLASRTTAGSLRAVSCRGGRWNASYTRSCWGPSPWRLGRRTSGRAPG